VPSKGAKDWSELSNLRNGLYYIQGTKPADLGSSTAYGWILVGYATSTIYLYVFFARDGTVYVKCSYASGSNWVKI
jgi:hypothetical protein